MVEGDRALYHRGKRGNDNLKTRLLTKIVTYDKNVHITDKKRHIIYGY